VAQKRIALGKLSKDFDRLKSTLSVITNECDIDAVSHERQNVNQLQLIQTLQGKDVDEAIQRERERDLRKINQDLAMVNEMFK
jgi:hypothetical protein